MAAEIEEKMGAVPELIRGDGGVFDVDVDGVRRFSKHDTGRFPEPGEILKLIET